MALKPLLKIGKENRSSLNFVKHGPFREAIKETDGVLQGEGTFVHV